MSETAWIGNPGFACGLQNGSVKFYNTSVSVSLKMEMKLEQTAAAKINASSSPSLVGADSCF